MSSHFDLNGKTVLITGGAGFIGSNLALEIQSRYPDCRLVLLDAFLLGHFQNLGDFRGTFIAGDISNPDDLARLAEYRFDAIFHQAAISDTTVLDQQRVVRVNTNAFHDLVKLALRCDATLVYASSAGVYGNSAPPNQVGSREQPENVYGFSKLMMDQLALRTIRERDLRAVGLRYFNVYGPREEHKGPTASMILQLSRELLAGRRPRLFKHGQQRRDFVYIDDVVQANLKALSARRAGVYNVGSGRARQFNEVLHVLGQELGVPAEAEYIDNPWSFYQNHTEADLEPTRQQLDYVPRFSLEEGIRAYVPWLRRVCTEGAPR